VELRTVAVRLEVPTTIVVEETKLVPVTVMVVGVVVPAGTMTGLRLVKVGTGLLTAMLDAEELPPPGAGFTTVALRVPAAA
jgi:hypothetical protein